MNNNKLNILGGLIIFLLLASNIYFVVKYLELVKQTSLEKEEARAQVTQSKKIVEFLNLLVTKVLKSEGDVNFESRLRLETNVRDLKDDQLLGLWQKFVDSKESKQAQQSLKDLLESLARKIKI